MFNDSTTNCDYLYGRQNVISKIQEAMEIRDQIEELAEELQHPDTDQLPQSIKKRSVPFGSMGTLGNYLFGTLTQEDADKLNEEIDKLYDSQNNITRLISR